MKDYESLKDYLAFTIKLIVEDAYDSKKLYSTVSSLEEKRFIEGKMLAYYEMLTTIKNQAIIMGIPLNELELDQIDLDKEFSSC